MEHEALRRRARSGLAAGAERAPARAHFRAMGIDPDRLDGPIVGVVSTWTGTMPCNLNQRELADRVAEGVTLAGGVPLGFNTIAVSDNQSQATPGMRASLISREVIADSIELMVHAHDFDALVCLVGCDKTVPAALMALARVDKPAVVLYSGPMRAGVLHGREVTIQTVWEAVAAEERGLIPRAELDELERFACPGAGTCAGHFTANTMAVALDCLGITVVGDGLIPADERKAKGDAAARAGALATSITTTARTFLDRRALLNAMTGIAATGGSTNGILHLLAIAREAEVPLTLDELAEIGARTPVIASLAPSGDYMAEDLHRVGGTATVIRELIRGGVFDGGAPAVTGETLAETTQDAAQPGRRRRVHDRAAVQGDRSAARAAREPRARRQPGQGIGLGAPCAARPRACLRQRGGVLRCRARRGRAGGRGARRAVRGTGGRPGHARDAERDLVRCRRGARRVGRARHRRPLLGRDARADGRSRGAGSGARRPACDRSRRR
jgi:dihydroxy-acid dehydratase